ncbi:MAG: hypothetical protein ACREYE_10720, partial [Gammaproteobacteria bacterium]
RKDTEDRAGAGQDGADQARIHPASREKEGGLTVKLFKGHYTSVLGPWKSSDALLHRCDAGGKCANGYRLRTNAKKMVERLCCYE